MGKKKITENEIMDNETKVDESFVWIRMLNTWAGKIDGKVKVLQKGFRYQFRKSEIKGLPCLVMEK
jgi:hypothetical protein